jgi:hypothetical protein
MHECCVPKKYPIMDGALGLRDLKVEMEGVGIWGQRVPVPDELTATLTLNQPHQLDPVVHSALHAWTEALFLKVRLLTPHDAIKRLRTPSNLLSNLDDSLHATRYHQRQFICRFRVVNDRHAQRNNAGSERLQIIFNDLPLRCELEAFLLRTSGTLDALGQFLGLVVTGKQRTYGDLLRVVKNKREIDDAVRISLIEVFNENTGWIEEAKSYRHAIVHRAEFNEFRGPILGGEGIGPAVIGERDAADFAIYVWGQLTRMVEAIGKILYQNPDKWDWPWPA